MFKLLKLQVRMVSSMNQKVLQSFKNQDLIKTQGFINGKWLHGENKETFGVNDPAKVPSSDAEIAQVDIFTENDYNNAIDAAYESFATFKKTTGRVRSELLLKLFNLIKANEEDLAKLIVLENGKPYADALGEVRYAASYFQWFSEEAPRVYGDVIPSANASSRIITMKQPVGVCGIITPWNFPLAMIARKLGAAVAAGCTTVIKPASETPLSALTLAYLCELSGFAPGVVNVLPSNTSSKVGALIAEHPLISKVSFTGSTNVGKILMKQSSSTLKKLSMELGGNAPFIVFDDADIKKAAQGALAAKFRSSGQTCVCANRILVHEKVYDEFATEFVNLIKETTTLGNGLDKNVTHGPVINKKSLQKVQEHVKNATDKGAEILYGGKHRTDLGEYFHDLTILGNVTTDMDIANEETFGPVAPLMKFKDEADAIRIANDTEVGLAGYFYSENVGRIFRVGEALKVGMIGVNTGAISESALPFGGVGESGFGREGSKYGVEDYTVLKAMVLGGIE